MEETKPDVPTIVTKDTAATKPVDTVKKKPDTVVVRPPDPNKDKQINYLALGDSYTIGESVARYQNFPNQLTDLLNTSGLVVNPPTIIARTGWTTSDLISGIKESGVISKFNFVTLLIGVNNQYQGQSQEIYRQEFKQLLQIAIDYAGGNKMHVFVISIPDWGVTSFAKGSGRDLAKISAEIDAFNAVNKAETQAAGISYTDITPDSRLAASDQSLIASDGLHPSPKMYKGWSAAVAPAILKEFK
jgi:lysophospholipase L1-like esterase